MTAIKSRQKALQRAYTGFNIPQGNEGQSWLFPSKFWPQFDYVYFGSNSNIYSTIGGKSAPLTIEKLRSFQGFEIISDEDAFEIIESLDQFSQLLLSCATSTNKDQDNGSTSSSSTIC